MSINDDDEQENEIVMSVTDNGTIFGLEKDSDTEIGTEIVNGKNNNLLIQD